MTLDEIKCPVVHATLEVLVMHLGRVAEAANRMDIDNLGLLFGQVKMREGKGTRQKLPSGNLSIPLRKISLKNRYFRSKNSIFVFFYTYLALFGQLYGLFGPFLTLFNTKTSFLVLLGKTISGEA